MLAHLINIEIGPRNVSHEMIVNGRSETVSGKVDAVTGAKIIDLGGIVCPVAQQCGIGPNIQRVDCLDLVGTEAVTASGNGVAGSAYALDRGVGARTTGASLTVIKEHTVPDMVCRYVRKADSTSDSCKRSKVPKRKSRFLIIGPPKDAP